MKVGLFYVSSEYTLDSWPVLAKDGTRCWIRVEPVETKSAESALIHVAPLTGEQFLNSMPLPVPK